MPTGLNGRRRSFLGSGRYGHRYEGQGRRRYRENRSHRYSERYPRRGGWGARRGERSGGLELFARLGFVARGIAYVVIGVIGVMLALGIAKHEPDRAGAIEAIATKPFGYLLLWILVIGFAGLAVWRFVQAANPGLNPSEGHRLRALACGIAYAIVFFSTLMFVLHGRTPTSSDTASRDYTARLLSLDGGRVIVFLAALVIIVIGIAMVLRGVRTDFTDHLRMGWMKASTQDAVVRLGQVGYIARGLVVIGIGIAALDAAVTFNSAKAKGVDGVLREFAQSAFGPLLLILVSLGLVAFGILSFFEAKWRRTYGGIPV